MARKRSKSKARKKKTPKDQASAGAVSVSEDEAPVPTEEEPKKSKKSRKEARKGGEAKSETAPDPDEEPVDEATTETQPAPPPAEPEPDVIVLTLDDDLDDEADRARLIAEAAGLATGDEAVGFAAGDETAAIAAEDQAAVIAAEEETDEVPPEASSDAGAAGVAAASDPGAEVARQVPNPDIPTLTPAALAALTAIHREGMATLPGEMVLDLGEGTTEEDRERLLAAALAHVEMQDAIYRVPSDSGEGRRWKGTIASSLFLLAALVVVVPPPAILPAPPATLSAADHLHGVRVSLLLQAEQIEAFRTREGRLPDSLDEVATALPDIRFVKSNNRLYQLVGHTPAGEAIVYDSATPDPEFQAIGGAWTGDGPGS